MNVKDATDEAIRKLSEIGGDGGLIAIDKDGSIAMPMNTPGMYRALYSANENEPIIKIFKDE